MMQFIKNLLWVWFSGFFEARLKQMVAAHREMWEIHNARGVTVNYPVGTKVILISNEPDDMLIGEVVGYDNLSKTAVPHYVLIIKNREDGKEYMTLNSNPYYWSEELEALLKKLNWAERWNVSTNGLHHMNEADRLRKESDEYQNRNKVKEND